MEELLATRNKDVLTGTYNRYFLKEFMQFELTRKKRYGGHLSILLCDLDNFKNVNDSFGHLKGDEILVYFARLLERNLRSSDIVVRYGGDEFILVLTDTAKEMAHFVAERIISEVNESPEMQQLGIGVSIGIAGYPEDGKGLSELIKKADQALYDSKRKGKGRFSLYAGGVNLKPIIPAKEFIGREGILSSLKETLYSNKNRAMLIEGPVGIGKTRLVEEVLKDQENVVRAYASLFGMRISYFEIKEGLKKLYKKDRTRFQAALTRSEPFVQNTIYSLLPYISTKETTSLDDRYMLFEALKRFFLNYFQNEPYILFIDDIQWASKETLDLLLYILEQSEAINVIMIKRVEEASKELEDFLNVLKNLSHLKEMEIPPLDEEETENLLKIILGEHLPLELVKYAFAHSGGNPFFIEEVTRELFEQGYLEVIDGEWSFKRPESLLISKSITDVLTRKLRELSTIAIRIMEIMALWDAPINVHTLSLLSGIDEGEILFNLDKLEYLKLVTQEANQYYLSAGAIRNLIIKDMTAAKRTAIHRKIATTLEHLLPENNEYIEKIAYHYYEGKERKKALKYLKLAYERAEKIKALSLARELLEKIITIEEDYEKLLRLANLQLETQSGERASDTILKYIQKYGARPKAMFLLAEIEERKGNIEEALKILNTVKAADEKTRQRVLMDRAWLLMLLGKYSDAEELLNKVLEYAGGRDYDDYYGALHYLATLYYSKGMYEKSIQYASEVIDYFKRQEKISFGAINTLALSYRSTGKYDEALRAFEMAIKHARDKGMPHSLATLLGNAALVYWDKYNYKEARKYFEEAISILTSMAAFDNAAFHMNNLIEMIIESGMIEMGEVSTEYIRKLLNRIHAFITGSTENETKLLTYINEVEYANLVDNQKERLYWAGELLNIARDIEDGSLKCYGLMTSAYALIDNCLLKEAMSILRTIGRISRKMETMEWEIYVIAGIYLVMKKAGKEAKAKEYMSRLEGLESKLPEDLKIVLYERIFRALIDAKEAKKAKKYYKKLLKLLKSFGSDDKIRYIEFVAKKEGL